MKGFLGELSAICLTEREWKTTALRRATYCLALVTNIDTSTPSVDLLKDPYGVLGTVARTSERVQITIEVSGREVKDAVRGRVDV